MITPVKIVVPVKLMPEADQAAALSATVRTVNDLACWVSEVAFANDVPREYELRKHTYAHLKEQGLGAQAAQHVIKKVRDAYTTLHANIRAGNLGKSGSKRRLRAESKPIMFRPESAQPYDDRCLSWQMDAQTVSIWTTAGRIKNVRFACSTHALKTLREYRKGESDLIERDGAFYLIATCEIPEAEQYEPDHFIGVDLGIVNIATTSTGYQAAGRQLNRYRKRQLALRAKLQKKRTKSAKRRLKERSRREQRHVKNTNHIIAKTIVTEAERTFAGLCLEELKGIRQRVRLRKPQRVALHSWAFAQLGEFIVYKARRAGVPVVYVDPAYSSRECAHCGHVDRLNRTSQATFVCRSCGVVAHADRNASHVLARRGENVWTAGRESRVPATP
ncbi:IS200/IS605 family transposase ISHut2 [Streptomyces sp. RB17]|uniref:RNA-guided endonuclease InsQ/TnpB family protein n=1 Tax=Streptomyces sp. RB17 TaxID=2585197 RepID=UPI001296D637|nr:RNA-guided endonuclease TnpB family protein [Streptomyces sp. RB17]MQY36991.1 IS200/IS605 family transposase ISHut2 [Streptomyces sp. RB17]